MDEETLKMNDTSEISANKISEGNSDVSIALMKELLEKEKKKMEEYYKKMEETSLDFEGNSLMEGLNKEVNIYKVLAIWFIGIIIIFALVWHYVDLGGLQVIMK